MSEPKGRPLSMDAKGKPFTRRELFQRIEHYRNKIADLEHSVSVDQITIQDLTAEYRYALKVQKDLNDDLHTAEARVAELEENAEANFRTSPPKHWMTAMSRCDGSGKKKMYDFDVRHLVKSQRRLLTVDCPGCEACQPKCPDCGYTLEFTEPVSKWGDGWAGYRRYWSEAEYPDEGSVYCDCQKGE